MSAWFIYSLMDLESYYISIHNIINLVCVVWNRIIILLVSTGTNMSILFPYWYYWECVRWYNLKGK